MIQTCRICSTAADHNRYRFRERMFGWGDEFDYFQCARCGCLQIARVPMDLKRFYPAHYYSFHLEPVPQRGVKAWLAGRRDRGVAANRFFGKCLARRFPARTDVESLGHLPLRRRMRVLDVGCGRGQLLSVLHRAGFSRLLGVDPYLGTDVEVVPGLWVLARELDQVDQQFDLIMLHHVFEHVADGARLMKGCQERLGVGGKILLRFPTVECEAWERYGEHWVQLDAPRHLFLHTRKSVAHLAEQAGLRIEQCWCDSAAFQFLGSELYRKGLPLTQPGGHSTPLEKHFPPEQMQAFAREAGALNAKGRGDQIAVVLGTPG